MESIRYKLVLILPQDSDINFYPFLSFHNEMDAKDYFETKLPCTDFILLMENNTFNCVYLNRILEGKAYWVREIIN